MEERKELWKDEPKIQNAISPVSVVSGGFLGCTCMEWRLRIQAKCTCQSRDLGSVGNLK